MNCRFCDRPLDVKVADLGSTPLCEEFLTEQQLWQMEPTYPLVAWVCTGCWLVQVDEVVPVESIFDDYAYYSSFSSSWLEHASHYVNHIVGELGLNRESLVVELASNDGYLLRNFVAKGIPSIGVEPAANVAQAAIEAGVETRVAYFSSAEAEKMRSEGLVPDLIIGNNVLAQVPKLNDFVRGISELLAREGTVTMEFPHLLRLLEGNQFDTIYHEHFSYFSLLTTREIFASHGLVIHDVEETSTHGGSLRIYASHSNPTPDVSYRVRELLEREDAFGLRDPSTFRAFESRVRATKRNLVRYLLDRAEAGERVAAYGAPGKGNTLLNYCGIGPDLVEYTVDKNPGKWNMYLPGSRIPIYPPERLMKEQPDVVLILPWNLQVEILAQLPEVGEWGGRFIVPIPEVREYS